MNHPNSSGENSSSGNDVPENHIQGETEASSEIPDHTDRDEEVEKA
ncbi:hypothetical protein KFU94_17750 [Chloroflexi bacterium TSY]|nr:hypothetical protein [Chloroflexi bacterium TSY]